MCIRFSRFVRFSPSLTNWEIFFDLNEPNLIFLKKIFWPPFWNKKSPLTEISGLKSYELIVCYRNLSEIAELGTHFWRKLGVNWRKLWLSTTILRQSIQLCACRNVRIDHQQMQLFFTVFVMHGWDQHTAGVDTHHRSRRQIGDCNAGLTDQFFRLIIFVNTTQNDPIYAGSVVQNEL